MTLKISFFSKLRKKVAKRTEKEVFYQYHITIPKAVAEAYELDRFIGKAVKVTIEIKSEF